MRLANIPVLLAVTFQLTGDRGWLSDRYRPTRSSGMDENVTGGLTEEIQEEVRRGAAAAITAWNAGTPAAVPRPAGDVLLELLTFVNGEDVPAEFEPMMAELLGHRPVSSGVPPPRPTRRTTVLVIGAGVAGLLSSLRLAEAGIDHTVVEKNQQVGGGWWENVYPGCGVDTPSFLYSFSFEPHRWSTFFGKRDEVHAYLEAFADRHDLRRDIVFGTEVTALDYAEADGGWTATLRAADGTVTTLRADAVISAVGVLNRPKVPDLPGMDDFRGEAFHSARWPEGIDLAGRRVAVVGSGASAMQIVPAVAGTPASLTVFQRSPQWIAPNADYFRPVDGGVHWLMENVPFYQRWYRAKLNWIFNDRVHPSLEIDPEWDTGGRSVNAVNDGHRRFYTRYIERQLRGRPDLLEKCLPDYPPFGKRMLLDNGWYAALRREDVGLVTEGVAAFTPTGLVDTGGDHHEADVVVLATGFESTRYLYPMRVRGRSGRLLSEVWGEHDARAYLGMTVPDFPNLFLLSGPNTGLGHGGSFFTIAEWQVRYVVEALGLLRATGSRTMECRADVCESYNEAVDAAHAKLVWVHPKMTNWYRNAAGRVVAASPWRIVDYFTMTRHVDPADFVWSEDHASGGE
ncbi:NAD(P)/FAD-dependent oxidoreductase [Streptomyces spongiae]|uniref:NAD(P)/FAD-dependent oxidoreductase n=1 Tax=Streptomyces spongiae TaxID=565072 RepID=A0A5N8XIH1_9ACTN|nr:NAD(P)/FAD-dependent oxidoreductase [Streptomyces spongiae]